MGELQNLLFIHNIQNFHFQNFMKVSMVLKYQIIQILILMNITIVIVIIIIIIIIIMIFTITESKQNVIGCMKIYMMKSSVQNQICTNENTSIKTTTKK